MGNKEYYIKLIAWKEDPLSFTSQECNISDDAHILFKTIKIYFSIFPHNLESYGRCKEVLTDI
jgi:hypothetical protein